MPSRLSLAVASLLLACAAAATAAPASKGALLPGSNSREPVSIDAAKLDYFDKEQKLIYSGDVVARQGDSTLKAAVLTIYLTRAAAAGGSEADKAQLGQNSSIDRMEASGPVTVIAKDEVGTGDAGVYSKSDNTITLTGHVTLTQATNVIKGDRLVYDMTSGQARVSGGQTQGRVMSVFTPQSGGPGPVAPKKPKEPAKGLATGGGPETAKTP